ncbi:DUF565 domain-containing protein [Altericista sp. CCNU0014]|uniref:DUF565 domain-containing protein n=1 Tax=Altericista sp. CCNU0014 TaxID=3082949 RepID=UPI00384E448D
MQNTRLNGILSALGQQVRNQLQNPWRRWATLTIALLFGIFLGIAISATAGAKSELDVTVAAIVVIVTELISWLFYSRKPFQQSWWGEALNALKLGVIYGLFLIAFMLGS